ncbi:MAG: OmpH family outer membrane protein [Gammaproteobacteria bacterium]
MHKALIGLFALGLVAAAPLAQASGTGKVGVVDADSILAQSDAGKTAAAKLKSIGDQHSSELQKKQDALQKEHDTIQKNASVETQAAQDAAQQKFQTEVQAFQQEVQQSQQDFQKQRQALLAPLQAKLYDVIQSYAKSNGYDLILDKGAAIYNNDSMDVTAAILKDFNAAEAQPSKPSSH